MASEGSGRYRAGPVAVTGATGQVGRALCRRLGQLGYEVRALGRSDDLPTGFSGAEVVVHLAGTLAPRRPNTYRAANLGTVEATVEALAGAKVQRVVFLSFVGADSGSPNAYLRYKGQAERLFEASGVPAVILRSNHIIGPPAEPGPTARAFLAKKGVVTLLGSGEQRFVPVFLDDVVEILLHAALEPSVTAGLFELAGPDVLSAADLARVLNGPDIRLRRVPGAAARVLGHIVPALTPELVDIMLSDALPLDAGAPRETFGVGLHPLAAVWGGESCRASLSR